MRELRSVAGSVALAAAALLLVALKLWLVSGQQLVAVVPSFADDELFVRLAEALASGGWLGPYDQYTLVKGPFYPAWIAFSSWLGAPLLRAQHALYAFACLLFVLALRPLLRRPALLFVLFAVLLFDPVTFSVHVLRVVREGVYPALTLAVCAGLAALLAGRGAPLPALALRAVALGAVLAALWLTREEGVWVLPGYFVVVGWIGWDLRRRGGSRRPLRVALCLLPLALGALGPLAVSLRNASHYGVFTVSEFKAREFQAAYGALLRAGEPDAPRYVLVSREARQRIYAASPSFAELRDMLEGPVGGAYAHFAAEGIPELAESGEMAGYLIWALRDAAAVAGYHASGALAMDFYRRLADEVNLACDSGALECGPPRATLRPPLGREHVGPLLRAFLRGIVRALVLEDFTAQVPPSRVAEERLDPFLRMTRERIATSARAGEQGVGVTRGDPPRLAVLERIGAAYQLATPLLCAIALAALGAAWARGRGGPTRPLGALCLALFTLFVTRVALLALLQATSFAAIDLQYLAPAYPPLLAFCVLAPLEARAVLRGARQRPA